MESMLMYGMLMYGCDINLYMEDPTAVKMEGFGVLFIPLSANFSWISVYVIIIATTRIMYA